MRVAESGDREERRARGGRWSAAYWPMLGGGAPLCSPGDTTSAKAFLLKLESAIDRGGWTRNEWAHLHELHRVWSARAYGDDPRFNLVGNRAGRLDREVEKNIKRRKKQVALGAWLRLARVVQAVNAADPKIRVSPSVLRLRRKKKDRR